MARMPLKAHAKAWLAASMSWAAGLVDALGWLAVYHVYTAHMTGNTTGFGIELFRQDWQSTILHAWPLIPFGLGLLFSAATTAAARRHGWHSSFSIALSTEFLLLIAFLALGSQYRTGGHQFGSGFYPLSSFLAAAMGIQTVTVTRVAGLRLYTTYLTGSLAKWSEAVALFAFWFYDRTRGRLRKRFWKTVRVSPRQKYARHAALTVGLWVSYFLGAVCGAIFEKRYGVFAIIGALIVLAVAIVIDLIAPVAAADESRPFDDL